MLHNHSSHIRYPIFFSERKKKKRYLLQFVTKTTLHSEAGGSFRMPSEAAILYIPLSSYACRLNENKVGYHKHQEDATPTNPKANSSLML